MEMYLALIGATAIACLIGLPLLADENPGDFLARLKNKRR